MHVSHSTRGSWHVTAPSARTAIKICVPLGRWASEAHEEVMKHCVLRKCLPKMMTLIKVTHLNYVDMASMLNFRDVSPLNYYMAGKHKNTMHPIGLENKESVQVHRFPSFFLGNFISCTSPVENNNHFYGSLPRLLLLHLCRLGDVQMKSHHVTSNIDEDLRLM